MRHSSILFLVIVALATLMQWPSTSAAAANLNCSPAARLTSQPIVSDASGALGLAVTVEGSAPGVSPDLVKAVAFSSITNATVVADGRSVAPSSSISLHPPAAAWQFVVKPVDPSAEVMVVFTVTDSCGSVPKFIGTGAGNMQSDAMKAKVTQTPTTQPTPSATPTRVPTQTATPTATVAPTKTATPVGSGSATSPVKGGWFYHPPSDGTSVQTMASSFASAVLTHGDETYRDQLRTAGMRGPILQYLMANEASGPPRAGGGGLRNSLDACSRSLEISYLWHTVSGIAGDFCTALHPTEANFVHNSAGERLYATLSWQEQSGTVTAYVYAMNPAAPGWQAYLAQRSRENLQAFAFDGLFMDNLDTSLNRLQQQEANSTGAVQEYPTAAGYRSATTGLLATLRAQVGKGLVWANTVGAYDQPSDEDAYLPYIDGVMREYFVDLWSGTYASPTTWEAQMQQAEKLSSQGKSFLGVAQGPRTDTARMRFAVASYLLVAGANSHLRYADSSSYYQAWLYPEFQAKLGAPTSARYQANGIWRRDYACGFVTADPASHASTISVDSSRAGCQ